MCFKLILCVINTFFEVVGDVLKCLVTTVFIKIPTYILSLVETCVSFIWHTLKFIIAFVLLKIPVYIYSVVKYCIVLIWESLVFLLKTPFYIISLVKCCVKLSWNIVKCIIKCSLKCISVMCPCIPFLLKFLVVSPVISCISFAGGYMLGQVYYGYFLMKIPFPPRIHRMVSTGISVVIGLGNAVCRQLRCISLLCLPMYCGKPGRGVLKVVVLTYVIAGPITNMALNAREVVRVYTCSTELSYSLSEIRHKMLARSYQKSVLGLLSDIEQIKDTFRSFEKVVAPIDNEFESQDKFDRVNTSATIGTNHAANPNVTDEEYYQKMFQKNLKCRTEVIISHAVALCKEMFGGAFKNCTDIPLFPSVCEPLKVSHVCNLIHLIGRNELNNFSHYVEPGLGEGYLYLKKAKIEMNIDELNLQYKINEVREHYDIQDAKETGDRIKQAFEEKLLLMKYVIYAVYIFVALFCFRIFIAACTYHDCYLTSIGFDNVYITGYFKRIDERRKERNKCSLLPLKKMERSKYVDVHSTAYHAERNKLFTQVLKVLLEMVTATTFVMLDRLFFEALDVVRQHAEAETRPLGEHDLDIQVEGKGVFANVVRTFFEGLNEDRTKHTVSNRECLPRPSCMPPIFYLKIYGGYLWILLLLYFNPYTLRLSRVICSWFYPRREKQRILHLYNDILKKRVKMTKTLRRKAVQAVRAHYLSGENMLSLRIKFPQLLGWLRIFPAARMTCLICGETEPRTAAKKAKWFSCTSPECPFVYCPECWLEIGEHCLACDPSLAELSDIDSLSEDEPPRY